MADPMRTLGVGSRFSVLVMAVAMLGGASACSTNESGAKVDATSSTAARTSEPEQLVQNMMGKAPVSAAAPEVRGAALPSEARASAAGVSRAKSDSLAPRSNGAETITSKHLEAELNRLEAELAN